MFVFNAKKGPDASTDDLGEGDKETENGRVLKLGGEDSVKDPVEAEDRVDSHGEVVDPRVLVAKDIAEKGVFSIGITQTCQVSIRNEYCLVKTYSNPLQDPKPLISISI